MRTKSTSQEPVAYMERTRVYYEAQGFTKPYHWAHHDEAAPFQPLKKPLRDCIISVITTGARYDRVEADPRFVDSGSTTDLPPRLFADDLAWDKEATHMNDIGSYLPIQVLNEWVADGKLASVGARFHCLPTEYSQRRTRESDASEILNRVQEDNADIALLVPL